MDMYELISIVKSHTMMAQTALNKACETNDPATQERLLYVATTHEEYANVYTKRLEEYYKHLEVRRGRNIY